MIQGIEAVDEEELLRRTARGDRRAFDELYRRTSPWLLVRLRRRCSDPDVLADVLQDTYLAVWRGAGSFVGAVSGGSSASWLWSIAVHRLVDALRPAARTARVPVVQALGTAAPAEDEALADHLGHEVEQALLALPSELRQVVQTLILDGLSVREAAVLLGMPEGTVKSRARRARIALREALS